MSEKITRVSESTRSHGGEHRKGDLSYARNRTICAGTEGEDTSSLVGMARRRSNAGSGGYYDAEDGDREFGFAGGRGNGTDGIHSLGGSIINEGKSTPVTGSVSTKGANHHLQTHDSNLSKVTRVIGPATDSAFVGDGEGAEAINGAYSSVISARPAHTSVGRLRQAYRQISSESRIYNRANEAMTNARKRVVRASIDSVKKSGAATVNALTLGRYKAVKESREEKRRQAKSREASDKKVSRKHSSTGGKRRNIPLLRRRKTVVGKLNNTVTRTIAMGNSQVARKEVQAGMMEASGVAVALAMKMVALVIMAVQIAVKIAVLAVTVIVGVIVIAVSSLAGVIAAVVAVVVFVAAIVGIVVSTNEDEDDGSTRVGMHSFWSVYEDLETQYANKITGLVNMGAGAGYESYEIKGEKAAAEDIVAVYLAVDTVNEYGTFEASGAWFTLDANGINLLTEIYWKFNEVSYTVEGEDTKNMVITAVAKDKQTVAEEYGVKDELSNAGARYFFVMNMVKNHDRSDWYMLPVGKYSF